MEEASQQAGQRLSRAESKASHLQQDLSQAEHRAHQVLPCPAPALHCPALHCTAFSLLLLREGLGLPLGLEAPVMTPNSAIFLFFLLREGAQPCQFVLTGGHIDT